MLIITASGTALLSPANMLGLVSGRDNTAITGKVCGKIKKQLVLYSALG